MASYFYHTPDDEIEISDNVDTLRISLAEFQSYEPAYTLAARYRARYYEPLVKHLLYTSDSQYDGGLPWTDGDGYIANLGDYINEHANPIKTLEEAKAEKIEALGSYSNTVKFGHVLLLSTEFFSSGVSPTALLSYQLAGSTPMGFYVKDVNDVHTSMTLAQFQSLNDAIVKLHNLCDVNYDTLAAEIEALTTVEDVEAFDIMTGWPVVPFDPS